MDITTTASVQPLTAAASVQPLSAAASSHELTATVSGPPPLVYVPRVVQPVSATLNSHGIEFIVDAPQNTVTLQVSAPPALLSIALTREDAHGFLNKLLTHIRWCRAIYAPQSHVLSCILPITMEPEVSATKAAVQLHVYKSKLILRGLSLHLNWDMELASNPDSAVVILKGIDRAICQVLQDGWMAVKPSAV